MALVGALAIGVNVVAGFTNRSLRAQVSALLGVDYTPSNPQGPNVPRGRRSQTTIGKPPLAKISWRVEVTASSGRWRRAALYWPGRLRSWWWTSRMHQAMTRRAGCIAERGRGMGPITTSSGPCGVIDSITPRDGISSYSPPPRPSTRWCSCHRLPPGTPSRRAAHASKPRPLGGAVWMHVRIVRCS